VSRGFDRSAFILYDRDFGNKGSIQKITIKSSGDAVHGKQII
jgi:hypothetical protein